MSEVDKLRSWGNNTVYNYGRNWWGKLKLTTVRMLPQNKGTRAGKGDLEDMILTINSSIVLFGGS